MSTPEAPVTPTPDVARAEELLAQLNNVLRLVVQSYPDDPSVQSARVAGVELRALVRDLAREREEW